MTATQFRPVSDLRARTAIGLLCTCIIVCLGAQVIHLHLQVGKNINLSSISVLTQPGCCRFKKKSHRLHGCLVACTGKTSSLQVVDNLLLSSFSVITTETHSISNFRTQIRLLSTCNCLVEYSGNPSSLQVVRNLHLSSFSVATTQPCLVSDFRAQTNTPSLYL